MTQSLLKPTTLARALLSTLALTGCSQEKPAAMPTVASAAKPAEAKTLTLDESKLPPVNRFAIGDLDTSKNACTDFCGYVNGKWLATNEIPGERTEWGAFALLDQR